MCVLLGQTRQSKTRSLIRGRTETFTRTGPHFFSVALRVLSFFFSLATYLSCWRLGEPRSIDDSLPTPQGNQIVSTSAASSSRRERDRPTTPSPAGHLCRGVRNGGLSDRGRRGEKRDRFTARIHRHDTTSPAYRHPTRRRPAADASTWKAKAKHHRTHGHLIKQLGIDAAGPLRTCWSLGKLSFNFKTIC